MKKIILLAIAAMFFLPMLPAQAQSSSPEKSKTSLIDKTQGKITEIAKADSAGGDLGGFAVLSQDRKTKEFKLIAKTRFFSAASQPIAFTDLKKGDKVTVLSVLTLKGENDVITVTQNK